MVSGASSAPRAITRLCPVSKRPSTVTSRRPASMRWTTPCTTSIPFLASRASGRVISLGVRAPVISHRSDGVNTNDVSRSTRTTWWPLGNALRSSFDVTSPPTPPPRITTVFDIGCSSEDQHLIGLHGPCSPLLKRTPVRAVDQFRVDDATRVHARPADAELSAASHNSRDHRLRIVITVRHLLAALGARGAVADEKHANFDAFPLRQ